MFAIRFLFVSNEALSKLTLNWTTWCDDACICSDRDLFEDRKSFEYWKFLFQYAYKCNYNWSNQKIDHGQWPAKRRSDWALPTTHWRMQLQRFQKIFYCPSNTVKYAQCEKWRKLWNQYQFIFELRSRQRFLSCYQFSMIM